MTSRQAVTRALAGFVAVLVAGCAPSPPKATPAATKTGCLTQSEATQVWTTINARIDAIELDPHHIGVSAVTMGGALTAITSYLQQQLVGPGFTEREVDHLDQLTVVQAGCNGGLLILNVTMTIVQDDYLNAAGQVNHRDPSVGQQLNVLAEYARSGGVWKETAFSDLTSPGATPTPQTVRICQCSLLYFA
ncbi:MAG: hypothetical protein WCB51_07015 [Candidatus Dormiibacterota bacterium]